MLTSLQFFLLVPMLSTLECYSNNLHSVFFLPSFPTKIMLCPVVISMLVVSVQWHYLAKKLSCMVNYGNLFKWPLISACLKCIGEALTTPNKFVPSQRVAINNPKLALRCDYLLHAVCLAAILRGSRYNKRNRCNKSDVTFVCFSFFVYCVKRFCVMN